MRLGLVVYPGNCTEERATIVVTDDKYYKIFSIMGILWRPLGSTVATFATVSLVWSNLGILNGLIFALLALVFWVLLLSMCSWVLQRLTSSRVRANAFIADSRSNPDYWWHITADEFTPLTARWQAAIQEFQRHLEADRTNIPLRESYAQFLLVTVLEGTISCGVSELDDLPPEYDPVLNTDIDGTVRDNYQSLEKHFGEVSNSRIRWTVQKMGEDARYYRTKGNQYRNRILEFASEPSYLAWIIVFVWLISVWMIGGNRVGESKADWWVYNACESVFEDCAPAIEGYSRLDAINHLESRLREVYPVFVADTTKGSLPHDCWGYTTDDIEQVTLKRSGQSDSYDLFQISFFQKDLVDYDPNSGDADYEYYLSSKWNVAPPSLGTDWTVIPEIRPFYLESEYECIP